MANQKDIYVAGFENRPPILAKGRYIQWSSRMIRYLKSKPKGFPMVKSILKGPYQFREIEEHCDPNLIPTLPPSPYADIKRHG